MHPFVVWLAATVCVYPKVSGVGLDQKSYGHHSSLGCRNTSRVSPKALLVCVCVKPRIYLRKLHEYLMNCRAFPRLQPFYTTYCAVVVRRCCIVHSLAWAYDTTTTY